MGAGSGGPCGAAAPGNIAVDKDLTELAKSSDNLKLLQRPFQKKKKCGVKKILDDHEEHTEHDRRRSAVPHVYGLEAGKTGVTEGRRVFVEPWAQQRRHLLQW